MPCEIPLKQNLFVRVSQRKRVTEGPWFHKQLQIQRMVIPVQLLLPGLIYCGLINDLSSSSHWLQLLCLVEVNLTRLPLICNFFPTARCIYTLNSNLKCYYRGNIATCFSIPTTKTKKIWDFFSGFLDFLQNRVEEYVNLG